MKLIKTLSLISIMLLLLPCTSSAQNKLSTMFAQNKQYLGVQLNPYLYEIEDVRYMRYDSKVFAVRYGMNVLGNLSVGPEISGHYWKSKDLNYKFSKTNFGLFARYTFLEQSNVRPIVESSVYYQKGNYFSTMRSPENYHDNKFNWYGAAGLGINLYKKKVTLDLMVKYSPDVQFEMTKFVPTYKINYHIH